MKELVIILTSLSSFIVIIIPLINTLKSYNDARQDKKFEYYHKLIDELVGGGSNNVTPMLYRQVAIIYELRFYSKYYPNPQRILIDAKNSWGKNERLIEEINFTLTYINSSWFERLVLKKY
ncbi:hypothetical protein [Adhaeribacter radiodurans]|uniref:Uncharacterized protein n=1 Tax=Adhaeribacter radiodurans TaxID=2745197 RepID=A0A7L7L9E5_9BACT|nr:hypothetical protein [Adhaeribacter radiodurans]QMU29009.1 hypothetical protein HUW48_13590 [Adhaeribacter radiodurans]